MHETQIVLFDFDYRTVCVSNRHQRPEEQDSGQKTLATSTSLIPHVCNKVVNGILVSVKPQVLNNLLFVYQKSERSVICSLEAHLRRHNK